MKPYFFFSVLIVLFFSCGKSKESYQDTLPVEPVSSVAPYDTTAIDSFSPGATSAIQREIERVKAAKRADSLKKIAAEEAKKLEAQKLAEEKEKQGKAEN